MRTFFLSAFSEIVIEEKLSFKLVKEIENIDLKEKIKRKTCFMN